MLKQVYICDKCGNEEPLTNKGFPDNWTSFDGKDYCDECSTKIAPLRSEFLGKVRDA